MASTSVREAIAARRSIRRFRPEPLSDEQIGLLLEAARLAPSSLNAQPWRFKVVRDPATIAWIADQGSHKQHWVSRAPAVFVCCADLSCYVQDAAATLRALKDSGGLPPDMLAGVEEYVRREECAPPEMLRAAAALNCAIAITLIMLQAVELDLGACWMGMFDEPAIKERLRLPDNLAVIALLAVGRPSESPPPRSRKTLDEIVIP